MMKKLNLFLFFTIIISLLVLIAPNSFAQSPTDTAVEYPTVGGINVTIGMGVAQYIQYIFVFSLGAVGVIALLFLVWNGIKYMASAGDPGKQNDAKEGIQAAILGLLLLLASYLILNTINPDLVSFNPSISAPPIASPDYKGITEIKIGASPVLTQCMDEATELLDEDYFLSCANANGYVSICDKEVNTPESCAWICYKWSMGVQCTDVCPDLRADMPYKTLSDQCESCLVEKGVVINPVVDNTRDVDIDNCPGAPFGAFAAAYLACVAELEKWELSRFDICKCGAPPMVRGMICAGENCTNGAIPVPDGACITI